MHLLDAWLCLVFIFGNGLREYEKKDLITLREEVRSMFDHAYSSYLTYAYPYDELRSLSCDDLIHGAVFH